MSPPKTSGGASTVEVTASSTASGDTVNATVSYSLMNQAVDAAMAEAVDKGTAPVVEVGAGTGIETAEETNSLAVTLPIVSLKTLATAGNSTLSIVSDVARITLDNNALSALAGQVMGSSITLNVAPVAWAVLRPAQRVAVADAPVVDLSMLSNGMPIRNYNDGMITVSLPYTLSWGQSANDVVVYYLDDGGGLESCATSYANGRVTFTTTHLSKYVIGTASMALQAPGATPFIDVAGGDFWYDAVLWGAAGAIANGTDDTHFSPLAGCTRAQFVTFLYRAAGSPAVGSTVNLFFDVSGSVHGDYFDAILWAAEQGIAAGTGNGMFSPDAVVTRAQSVTFMCRYAQRAGIAAQTGVPGFDDVRNEGDLAAYYDAIGWAAANGITNGNSDTANTFGPMEACSRGMMITFLHRLFTEAAV